MGGGAAATLPPNKRPEAGYCSGVLLRCGSAQKRGDMLMTFSEITLNVYEHILAVEWHTVTRESLGV